MSIKPLSPVVVLERLQARSSRSSRFAAPAPAPVAKVWTAERPQFAELALSNFTIGCALKGVK